MHCCNKLYQGISESRRIDMDNILERFLEHVGFLIMIFAYCIVKNPNLILNSLLIMLQYIPYFCKVSTFEYNLHQNVLRVFCEFGYRMLNWNNYKVTPMSSVSGNDKINRESKIKEVEWAILRQNLFTKIVYPVKCTANQNRYYCYFCLNFQVPFSFITVTLSIRYVELLSTTRKGKWWVWMSTI